ncbi:Stf0 family sulfotransferase [Plastorhodobacter daqingensis]|uniref:Stf0 family sulfotransferase n=1 Tax=Plastorhodobacter daqingensis TaxID=1387281 RepID=A0ABW2UNU7_9RHOB
MTARFFHDVTVDENRKAQLMRQPAATRTYVIHFTPRSGSSWLTEVISRTGQLSAANEAFNPNFIPRIAQALGAATMEDYIALLLRRFNTGGIYGVEITAHQMNAVFGSYEGFHRFFPDVTSFWLTRKDIVAQAVSLAKMVTTSVAHTPGLDAQRLQEAERGFDYDAKLIKQWLLHILVAEEACEDWFEAYDLAPRRLCYEQITTQGPGPTLDEITGHLGLPPLNHPPGALSHAKLGTQKNAEFAERFRREHPSFLSEVAARRQRTLSRLPD